MMNVFEIDRPAVAGLNGTSGGLPPFADSRDHRLYYPAPGHEAVMDELRSALQEGYASFIAVTGDSGSGKTYLRSLLHGELDSAQFVRVSIENSLLDFDQLLLEIISQLGNRRALAADWPDRYARLAELKRILVQQVVRQNRHLVVLMDEAQGLTGQTLENLRLLTNISTEQRGFMTFVLFGSPALEDLLRSLPELARRVGPGLLLQPMDRDTLKAYVRHHFARGGKPGAPQLGAAGWEELYRVTGGLPGQVNRVMRATLRHTARMRAAVTDATLAATLKSESRPFDGPGNVDWLGYNR